MDNVSTDQSFARPPDDLPGLPSREITDWAEVSALRSHGIAIVDCEVKTSRLRFGIDGLIRSICRSFTKYGLMDPMYYCTKSNGTCLLQPPELALGTRHFSNAQFVARSVIHDEVLGP